MIVSFSTRFQSDKSDDLKWRMNSLQKLTFETFQQVKLAILSAFSFLSLSLALTLALALAVVRLPTYLSKRHKTKNKKHKERKRKGTQKSFSLMIFYLSVLRFTLSFRIKYLYHE